MSRVLLLLLLWVLQATLILLLVNAGWVQRELQAERTLVKMQFGADRARAIDERSHELYRRWLVDSGVTRAAYQRLLPDRTVSSHGMEGLAPWFFRWLEQRLLALWWLAFEAIYRMQLMDAWSGYLIVLAVAGCVDGLVRRQIRRIDHGYASGDQHLIARRSITVLAIAPLIYLCVPVTVVPMVIPAWGGLLVLALAQLTANLQHRI